METRWAEADLTVNALVVEPSRKRLDGKLIEASITMQPKRIIYISCTPSTLARDLALLAEGGYNVVKAQPVDLFPQTIHVETVVLLQRKII